MKNLPLIIALLLSLVGYIGLGYFTVRTDFTQFIALVFGLYILYWVAYKMTKSDEDIYLALGAAIGFRAVLLFVLPNLSDDYFRFYWDGLLLSNGISPFADLPKAFIAGSQLGHGIAGINEALYSQLNSPEYFTIYPPVCQFVFWVGAKLFPANIFGAVVVMKSFMLLFELGSIYFIKKLVDHYGLIKRFVLLYALNPLVIFELTGNLHFEGAMICFSLMAVWLLVKKRWVASALAMALAVCAKLLPLIFLPFLIKRLKAKSLIYFGIVGAVSLILFLPLFNISIVQNLWSSIDLYFQKFEFNASVYYVVREIGFWVKGWNIIETAGPYLALTTFASIMLLTLFEKNLSNRHLLNFMLFALTIYLVFANIVHPWYVTPLIAFGIFSQYRYPILWSALITLTYYTYATDAYTENLWIVLIEYLVVAVFGIYEYFCHKEAKTAFFDNVDSLEESCLFSGVPLWDDEKEDKYPYRPEHLIPTKKVEKSEVQTLLDEQN